MRVFLKANQYIHKRGYTGADLEVPASRYEVADAFQQAHISEGGSYELSGFEGWPGFVREALMKAREKTLEEVNLLADQISGLDGIQLDIYEGALALRQDADMERPISMKELINILYNLETYALYPEILNDRELGNMCMEGELLDCIRGIPVEVWELLDAEKVGQMFRKEDHGTFTGKGYIFQKCQLQQEIYDGIHIPKLADAHDGIISLRLKSAGKEQASGIWLELPASEQVMKETLEVLKEQTFDSCRIMEVRSIVPALGYQFSENEDIEKINILAERIAAFPDSRTLAKYKAVLELEVCNELNLELDIARNLNCYTFDPEIFTPEDYAAYLLQEAGFDPEDPAFAGFDFQDYGQRKVEENGLTSTAYGMVIRNEQPFVPEYTDRITHEMDMQIG